jgi:ferric-dicitrate binding protein FerR (iron transport regulator)
VALNTPIVVEGKVRIEAEGNQDARLCPDDGSLLELAPGSAVDVRPADDRSRLVVALQEGSLQLLAREPSYQFATSACPLSVSDAPARIQVERRDGATHLMVEKGSAVCASGSEPTLLPTCWELVVAPGEEPQIAQYCGVTAEVPATVTLAATAALPSTVSPTVEAPSGTPSPSPPPEATREPTPIP